VEEVAHAFPEVQGASCTQAMQPPAKHVWPVPQLVPSRTAVPWSSQTEVPVAQLVSPAWQGLPVGVQATSAAQATQEPALQTWSIPQIVPLATGTGGVALSTHVEVPVAQLVTPTTHGFAGVQDAPATQPTHEPPLQTWSVPQAEPSRTLPVSTHVATPEEHWSAAVWQTLVVDTQGVPHAADWSCQELDTVPPPCALQLTRSPPDAASAPEISGEVHVVLQPPVEIPAVSKAMETMRLVPSAQERVQAALVPHSNC
jgi:hypothetical protein